LQQKRTGGKKNLRVAPSKCKNKKSTPALETENAIKNMRHCKKSRQTGITSTNTRLLGGQRAAANCRFVCLCTVHSLCLGGVMSAMRQLQQA
jgi:hypothetical protein